MHCWFSPGKLGGSMDFIDKELKCVDCGKTFVFSAAEQAFFKDRGFKNDPKHCKQCKAQRYGGRRRTETRVDNFKRNLPRHGG